MDNDKKELIYVMNLLKNKPSKEISKDYSCFKINKKFQFNYKPESKFEPVVINDNFFNKLFAQSPQNETVFITLQDNKSNKNTDTNNDTFSTTKNTLTKQYSAKDIINHPNPKAATFFQKNKPNLNITKFSNSTRTDSLLREHRWFKRGNNFSDYNSSSFFKKKEKNLKMQRNIKKENFFMNRLISKIKIRYLKFRPYIDLPTIKPNISNIKEENNKFIDMDNSDALSINSYNNNYSQSVVQSTTNYYFKLIGNECLLVKKLLEDNGFIQSKSGEPWTIAWSSGHIKLTSYEKLSKYQKMNHFPRSNELTRKDLLYKNLSKLKELFPGTKFDFLPESYILPNEFTFLKDRMDKNPNQFWIVKPVASSQGRGIF